MADDKKQAAIDEAYMAQWVEYGLGELNYYLLKCARLDEWERLHPRTEESPDADR